MGTLSITNGYLLYCCNPAPQPWLSTLLCCSALKIFYDLLIILLLVFVSFLIRISSMKACNLFKVMQMAGETRIANQAAQFWGQYSQPLYPKPHSPCHLPTCPFTTQHNHLFVLSLFGLLDIGNHYWFLFLLKGKSLSVP